MTRDRGHKIASFSLLLALKSPQVSTTLSCSSAIFLGSLCTLVLKSNSYYEI